MIEDTSFGKVKIEGETYKHDIVIYPDKIIKREKEISKSQHGTSHNFTKEEMKEYIERTDQEDIKQVIVGTGQYGKLELLPETEKYLEVNGIDYKQIRTPDLVGKYLDISNSIIIIHVTC
ncbi:MAG: MTH938/NDUFAF3 family protein [Thermoplasmata archaeon]